MAELNRSAAALRIMGDDLNPEDITRILGCQPTCKQIKGEELVGRKTGTIRIAKFGMWSLESISRQPGNIDAQIQELLGKLSPSIETWNEISSRFEVDLFCGLFMDRSNEGISISAKSMTDLGIRGIELDLDIYGTTED